MKTVFPDLKRRFAAAADSPLARRMAGGAFWSLLGAVLSRLVMLATSFALTRTIGRGEYGRLAIVQSTFLMFQVMAAFGLSLTAARYVACHRAGDPARAGRIIALSQAVATALGVALAAVLLLLAPVLATRSLGAPDLATPIWVGAALVFAISFTTAQEGALRGFERFRAIAASHLVAALAGLPLQVAGARLAGLPGILWAMVLSAALGGLVNHIALRDAMRREGIAPDWRGARAEWRVLGSFSLPAVLGSLVTCPAGWAANAILVRSAVGGFAAMGLFGAATQWRLAVVFLPNTLSSILLPILSGLDPARDRRFGRALWINVAINAAVALAVAVPAAAFAPRIMSLYGPAFVDGAPVLALMALSAVLAAVATTTGQAIAGAGRLWTGLTFNVLWALVLVGGAALLAPRHGAVGLALAWVIAYAAHATWQGWFVATRLTCRRPSEPN